MTPVYTRFFCLLLLAGCGGRISDVDASTTNDASKTPHCNLVANDYATSCATANDCAIVFLGNVCTSTCACENGTISSTSKNAYEADFEAASDGGGLVCPCPPPEPPSCCKGSCVLGPCP